jgi:cytochrome c oxidase subunit 4
MAGHISPKSNYFVIFGALMACTMLTVIAAFINLGDLNFPVALVIAVFKATLVILFFMHVKYSSRMVKLVVGVAFFFLVVLLTLTLTDYLSRGWFTAPGGSTAAGAITALSGPPQPVPPVEPVQNTEPGQNTSPK